MLVLQELRLAPCVTPVAPYGVDVYGGFEISWLETADK
jgi:hypothetical protein